MQLSFSKKFKKHASIVSASLLAVTAVFSAFSPSAEAASTVRYAHLQPFSPDSIWNTAIGSGAKFEPANGTRTLNLQEGSAYINSNNGYGISMNIAQPDDPIRKVTFQGKTFEHRIPENASIVSGTDGNLNVIDGRYVYEYWVVERKADGNYTAGYGVKTDLLGSGIEGGIRAGQFSTNAGLIRKHELENLHMPHALVMALSNEQLKSGWVYPAISEDGGTSGNKEYAGTIPMGSLFAIPPEVDINSLGLSPEGVMLAKAMQDYGVYVGDRSTQVTLYASDDVEREMPEAYKRMTEDFREILRDELRYVTNSSKNSIGGGGERRQTAQAKVIVADDPSAIDNPAHVAEDPAQEPDATTEPDAPGNEGGNETDREHEVQSPEQDKSPFSDVPSNHRFSDEIRSMMEQGLIQGYEDGTYRPDEPIDRRHVAEILSRSDADFHPVRGPKSFADVPESHPNYEGIQNLYRAGIVDGDKKGNFNPSSALTRAESAKIFVNAFDLKEVYGAAKSFGDVSSSYWAFDYIRTLSSHGITLGSEGNYMPSKSLTRGQYAAFLARLLK